MPCKTCVTERSMQSATIFFMKRYDTMSPEETRKLYREMKKEQLAAEYTLPSKPSSDGYYHLWIKDENGRRQIKAKTIDKLKEKLYEKNIPTFKQVFEMTQEDKTKYIKNEEKLLSVKNTMKRTASEYKRFFEGTDFENIPIEEITKKELEDICLLNLRRHDLTVKGFLSMRGILKGTLSYAFENYMTVDNVYLRMNFTKFNDMLIDPTPVEERVHSSEEVVNILKAIEEHHDKKPYYFPAYALELQIAMGLRRGEVPPLRWSDVKDGYVEICREQLTVRDTSTYCVVVSHTKTRKNRRFPITDQVANILEKVKEIHEETGIESEFLFPGKSKSGCITNDTVYNFYSRTCKKLGIEISRDKVKGTHSFRRNAITEFVNATNGNLALASKLYGNSPDVANKNYYTGVDMDEARSIIESRVTNR